MSAPPQSTDDEELKVAKWLEAGRELEKERLSWNAKAIELTEESMREAEAANVIKIPTFEAAKNGTFRPPKNKPLTSFFPSSTPKPKTTKQKQPESLAGKNMALKRKEKADAKAVAEKGIQTLYAFARPSETSEPDSAEHDMPWLEPDTEWASFSDNSSSSSQ